MIVVCILFALDYFLSWLYTYLLTRAKSTIAFVQLTTWTRIIFDNKENYSLADLVEILWNFVILWKYDIFPCRWIDYEILWSCETWKTWHNRWSIFELNEGKWLIIFKLLIIMNRISRINSHDVFIYKI